MVDRGEESACICTSSAGFPVFFFFFFFFFLPGIRRREEYPRLFAWGYCIVIVVNTIGNCISTFVVGTCIYVVSGGLRQKQCPVMMVISYQTNLLVHYSLFGQDSTVQRRRRDCDQPFPATNICANICHGGSQDGMAIHSLLRAYLLLSHCHTPDAMTSE